VEFHHVILHTAGGRPTAKNVELRCRGHNASRRTCSSGRPGATCARRPSRRRTSSGRWPPMRTRVSALTRFVPERRPQARRFRPKWPVEGRRRRPVEGRVWRPATIDDRNAAQRRDDL